MLKRIGVIALPIGLIAAVAFISWRAVPDVQPTLITPQDRPGATAWGGLNWGASAKEVMALYPNVISVGTDTTIQNLDIGGTRMTADLTFENDRLVGVGLVRIGVCEPFAHLAELLIGRYGSPGLSDARSRVWRGKTSYVTLDCGDGVLSLRYADRAVVDRKVRTRQSDDAVKAKEDSRGL